MALETRVILQLLADSVVESKNVKEAYTNNRRSGLTS